MRSYLFVPGDSERKLAKALTSGADCLLIDLEDSVALGKKNDARKITADFLTQSRKIEDPIPALFVRVNALDTDLTEDDLASIIPAHPDGILLPKSQSGADTQKLSVMTAVHEVRAGLTPGTTTLHAIITETALGLLNSGTYSAKPSNLKAVSWGAEDLAADIGASSNKREDGTYSDVFRHARTMTLLCAASNNLEAVDTVYTDFKNSEGLRSECRAAVRDGFSGKMAIHPAQVPIINAEFTPPEADLVWAQKIVALFDAAGENTGVLSLDGKMIDRPHLRQAKRVIARSNRD